MKLSDQIAGMVWAFDSDDGGVDDVCALVEGICALVNHARLLEAAAERSTSNAAKVIELERKIAELEKHRQLTPGGVEFYERRISSLHKRVMDLEDALPAEAQLETFVAMYGREYVDQQKWNPLKTWVHALATLDRRRTVDPGQWEDETIDGVDELKQALDLAAQEDRKKSARIAELEEQEQRSASLRLGYADQMKSNTRKRVIEVVAYLLSFDSDVACDVASEFLGEGKWSIDRDSGDGDYLHLRRVGGPEIHETDYKQR